MAEIHNHKAERHFLCSVGLHSGSYISEAPTSCRNLYACSRCNKEMTPSSSYHVLAIVSELTTIVLGFGMAVATAFAAFSYLPFFIAALVLVVMICIAMWVHYSLEHLIDSAEPKPVWVGHESYSPYEYVSEQDCTQIATCTRCGDRRKRVVHTYGDSEYESSDACRKVAACKRCGDITSSVLHTFDEGNYTAPDDCAFLHVCTRCGEQLWSHIHQFQDGKRADEVVCQRCGVVEHRERDYSDYSRNFMYDSGGIRYM